METGKKLYCKNINLIDLSQRLAQLGLNSWKNSGEFNPIVYFVYNDGYEPADLDYFEGSPLNEYINGIANYASEHKCKAVIICGDSCVFDNLNLKNDIERSEYSIDTICISRELGSIVLISNDYETVVDERDEDGIETKCHIEYNDEQIVRFIEKDELGNFQTILFFLSKFNDVAPIIGDDVFENEEMEDDEEYNHWDELYAEAICSFYGTNGYAKDLVRSRFLFEKLYESIENSEHYHHNEHTDEASYFLAHFYYEDYQNDNHEHTLNEIISLFNESLESDVCDKAYFDLGRLYISHQTELPGGRLENYYHGLGFYICSGLMGNKDAIARLPFLTTGLVDPDGNEYSNFTNLVIEAHKNDPNALVEIIKFFTSGICGYEMDFLIRYLKRKYKSTNDLQILSICISVILVVEQNKFDANNFKKCVFMSALALLRL